MFARIATSALIAGSGAGLIAAALTMVFMQPLLLEAELYETGEAIHFGASTRAAVHAGWALDLARDALTFAFFALIYVAYGLLLVAGMALAAARGVLVDARTGILWGVAGWTAVQMAPAFGLPPELPGFAAADLTARQVWWFGTVAVTAAGLACLAFGRGWALWAGGIVLLAAPHIIGAPMPDAYTGPTPPELSAEYAARSLGIALVGWTVLGSLAGKLWHADGGRG